MDTKKEIEVTVVDIAIVGLVIYAAFKLSAVKKRKIPKIINHYYIISRSA